MQKIYKQEKKKRPVEGTSISYTNHLLLKEVPVYLKHLPTAPLPFVMKKTWKMRKRSCIRSLDNMAIVITYKKNH